MWGGAALCKQHPETQGPLQVATRTQSDALLQRHAGQGGSRDSLRDDGRDPRDHQRVPSVLFFFFFFLIYFIYLFGCVGSSFLCEGFL